MQTKKVVCELCKKKVTGKNGYICRMKFCPKCYNLLKTEFFKKQEKSIWYDNYSIQYPSFERIVKKMNTELG